MRQRSTCCSLRDDRGFTLLELLVSLFISSTVLGIVISSVLNLRNTYFTEIKRTQINGNLRSAMDIMSMNVRQSGENLLSAFPAILLEDGASGASDVLTLRRSPITEVLSLCADAAAGTNVLQISSASLSNAECIPANVGPVYSIFTTQLGASNGALRIFLYDNVLKTGEFVEYMSGSFVSGQYSLSVGTLSRSYSQLTTSIYVLEEYQFSRDADADRLELTVNDDPESLAPVAFGVTDFQVAFDLQDGSTVTSFAQNGTTDWKDVRAIRMTLSGMSEFKGHEVRSTITSTFFPRNVLSYEGM